MVDNMRELLEEADKRYSEWHLEDAARLYEEAVTREPNFRYAVNRLAQCYAMQGQIKKLIHTCLDWQKYLTENKIDDLAGEVSKAILCFDPGSVEGRVGMLEHIRRVEGEEEYFRELSNTVNYFLEIDECELAIKVLENAQKAFPANVNIAVKLADMLMAEGDIDKAINSYRTIIKELESTGASAQATEVYRRLEYLTPDDSSIIMRLAEIYLDNEKYEEAAGEYRNALRVDYSDSNALRGLGISLAHMQDYNGAVLAFRKAVVIDPSDVETREQLANAYIATGNVEAAVKDLLAAGTHLLSCEEFAEAQRIYETILKLAPDHAVAVRELSNIKDSLARQKAREEQIRKLQTGGIRALQAEAAKKEKEAQAQASADNASEDLYDGTNPYAGGTDLYGGDDLYGAPLEGELGTPDSGDGVQLGAISDTKTEGNDMRVLATAGDGAGIYNPVLFVVAKFPDMVPLIQQLITEAPSQDIFGWNYLPKLDMSEKTEAKDEKAEEFVAPPLVSEVAPAKSDGAAVSSAFGESSGSMFESAFANAGKGGLFSGGSFGVKSRFAGSSSSSEDKGSSEAGLSLVERIQQQQKRRSKR